MGKKNEEVKQPTNEQPTNEQPTGNQSTGEQPTGDQSTGEQPTGDQADEGADEDEAKDLIALVPVLYLSHQYKVGDKLPANNPDMVQAWIDAESAVWMSARKELPKAKPMTAEPGLPGMASASETKDNLVGKVPKTPGRKK